MQHTVSVCNKRGVGGLRGRLGWAAHDLPCTAQSVYSASVRSIPPVGIEHLLLAAGYTRSFGPDLCSQFCAHVFNMCTFVSQALVSRLLIKVGVSACCWSVYPGFAWFLWRHLKDSTIRPCCLSSCPGACVIQPRLMLNELRTTPSSTTSHPFNSHPFTSHPFRRLPGITF